MAHLYTALGRSRVIELVEVEGVSVVIGSCPVCLATKLHAFKFVVI